MDRHIGLEEAAKLAGKSSRTLRRWVQTGQLNDMRVQGDHTSPIVVSKLELQAQLAGMSQPPHQPEQQRGHQGPPRASYGQP